jgi:hypothetical protein
LRYAGTARAGIGFLDVTGLPAGPGVVDPAPSARYSMPLGLFFQLPAANC